MRNLGRSSAAVLAAVLTVALGCAIGPIWAKRLEGRVVNGETGEPVEGALVLQRYRVRGRDLVYTFDDRWTTTDEAGRFAIPGHIALTSGPPFTYTADYPLVEVVHRGLEAIELFSWVEDPNHPRAFPGWRELELAVEPGRGAHVFEDAHEWAGLCRGYSGETCDRLCEAAYGSVEACVDASMPR